MAPARLEVNFVRLLSRCEYIALEKRGDTDWRLEKYIGALEDMLRALMRRPSKPAAEVLKGYRLKVDFLRRLLKAEKVMPMKATATLLPGPRRTPAAASEMTAIAKKCHMQKKTRFCTRETYMRKRRALPQKEWGSEVELDAMLQQQQRLAEDILHLAHSLKKNDKQVLCHRADQEVCKQKGVESEPPCLVLLGLVLVTFISTILFFRLFPELL